MEEEFWLMEQLHQGYDDVIAMPVAERKWYFDRLVKQRARENEERKKELSKSKRR